MTADKSEPYLIPYEHGAAVVEETDDGLLVHGFVWKLGKRTLTKFSPDLEANVAETLWENGLAGNVSFIGSDRAYLKLEDGAAELIEAEYTPDDSCDTHSGLEGLDIDGLTDEEAVRYWNRKCEGRDGQEEI